MPVESSRNRLSPRFRLLADLGHATLRACLEAHFQCRGGAVQLDHRSKCYARRCPNLRGPTRRRYKRFRILAGLCLVEVSTVLRKANRRLVRWHEDADMSEGCAGVGRGSALDSWRSRGEIHRLATTHAWRIRPTAGNDLRCAKKGPLSLTPALSMPLW
jgi:hypothetical protein